MNVYNIFTHTVCVTISNRKIDLMSHIERLIIFDLKWYFKILPEMMWRLITMWEVIVSFLIIYNIFTHTVCVTIYNRKIDLVSHIDRLIKHHLT